MRRKYFTLIALFIAVAMTNIVQGQDKAATEIDKALNKMDAQLLAGWFNDRVDLETGSTTGNFSRNQAEVIMKEFFRDNPVSDFKLNHKGSSDGGSRYMVGSYLTRKGSRFRVYILLKKAGEELKIFEMQFEKE
ncbi:MAG: hypothetical protein Kow00127_18870 [Bacteroidales bacterium]